MTLYSYLPIVLLSYIYISVLFLMLLNYILHLLVEGSQFALSEKPSLVWVERRPRYWVKLCNVITSLKGENSITTCKNVRRAALSHAPIIG